MRSVLLVLDLPEHADDEVDGGAAGHEGGHRHHQAGVLGVTHGDRDLKQGTEVRCIHTHNLNYKYRLDDYTLHFQKQAHDN